MKERSENILLEDPNRVLKIKEKPDYRLKSIVCEAETEHKNVSALYLTKETNGFVLWEYTHDGQYLLRTFLRETESFARKAFTMRLIGLRKRGN